MLQAIIDLTIPCVLSCAVRALILALLLLDCACHTCCEVHLSAAPCLWLRVCGSIHICICLCLFASACVCQCLCRRQCSRLHASTTNLVSSHRCTAVSLALPHLCANLTAALPSPPLHSPPRCPHCRADLVDKKQLRQLTTPSAQSQAALPSTLKVQHHQSVSQSRSRGSFHSKTFFSSP